MKRYVHFKLHGIWTLVVSPRHIDNNIMGAFSTNLEKKNAMLSRDTSFNNNTALSSTLFL